MTEPSARSSRESHRAAMASLAMAAAVLGFVIALTIAEGSEQREAWLLLAIALWALAAVIGVLHAPRWLAKMCDRYWREK